jgi:hypothetical protein
VSATLVTEALSALALGGSAAVVGSLAGLLPADRLAESVEAAGVAVPVSAAELVDVGWASPAAPRWAGMGGRVLELPSGWAGAGCAGSACAGSGSGR